MCQLPASESPSTRVSVTPVRAGAPNHLARAPARSFLRAAGFTDADFKKPFVSLSVPWTTGQPCNLHHRELGDILQGELESAGAKAFVCVHLLWLTPLSRSLAGFIRVWRRAARNSTFAAALASLMLLLLLLLLLRLLLTPPPGLATRLRATQHTRTHAGVRGRR